MPQLRVICLPSTYPPIQLFPPCHLMVNTRKIMKKYIKLDGMYVLLLLAEAAPWVERLISKYNTIDT